MKQKVRLRLWGPKEFARALDLHAQGVPYAQIAVALNRTIGSVKAKFGARLLYDTSKRPTPCGFVSTTRAPESSIIERDRRYLGREARDITQTLMGDPPKGFSALDQRTSPL